MNIKQLKTITAIQGDCMEYMKLLRDKSFDLAIIDCEYGIGASKPSKNPNEALIQQGNKNLNQKRIHPTEKPIKLYEWLLINYAKHGYKILDTHGGSMSHAIACHNLGYELTIIEKDNDYYTKAVERLRYHQRQGFLFAISDMY